MSAATNHPAESVTTLACRVAQILREALAEASPSGTARASGAMAPVVLAVSGGRSPIALFEALAQPVPGAELDWSRITVVLVDERCVPHAHPDSNTALVRRHLLKGAAAHARLIPPFDALPAPADGSRYSLAELEALTTQANQRLQGLPPMALALLGMGEDGHTASLFPGAPGLQEALSAPGPMAWVNPATAAHARLTLTLPALLAARHRLLSIAGPQKQAVLAQAQAAATADLPISLVLHGAPTEVWATGLTPMV